MAPTIAVPGLRFTVYGYGYGIQVVLNVCYDTVLKPNMYRVGKARLALSGSAETRRSRCQLRGVSGGRALLS